MSRIATIYTCDRIDPKSGEICGLSSKRKSNIERHIARKHKESIDRTFVNFVVGNQGALQEVSTIPRAVVSPVPGTATATATAFSPRNLQISVSSTHEEEPQSNSPILTHAAINTTPVAHYESTTSADSDVPQPQISGAPSHISTTSSHSSQFPNSPRYSHNPALGSALPPWDQRKNTRRKHLLENSERDGLPEYNVKRSKKWPLQQRAVEWLTHAGKLQFDGHLATLLSQWGIKPAHKGTCVLLPADWVALDPLKLAQLFKAEECPRTWADGPVSFTFQFSLAFFYHTHQLTDCSPTNIQITAQASLVQLLGLQTQLGRGPVLNSTTSLVAAHTDASKVAILATITCASSTLSLKILI